MGFYMNEPVMYGGVVVRRHKMITDLQVVAATQFPNDKVQQIRAINAYLMGQGGKATRPAQGQPKPTQGFKATHGFCQSCLRYRPMEPKEKKLCDDCLFEKKVRSYLGIAHDKEAV